MNRRLCLLTFALAAAACGGGGGGGGGGGPPPPPPPPFAETSNTMLGIANRFREAAVLGSRVLVAVSEPESALDLNNDGDQTDAVAHVVDTTDGATTNLGLAIVGSVLASDALFAFLVSEAGQGGDLNGDGDLADSVWHVYDPVGGTLVNAMIATQSSGLAGVGTTGGFVLLQSEPSSGNADVNLDGDALDTVVRVFDGATLAVTGLVLGPQAAGRPLVARNGRVLLTSDEPSLGPAGADLNGDGDQLDVVLGAVDFTPGVPMFRNLARAVANHPFVLTDGAAAYLIDELTDGAIDRNGDGDTGDAILAVFDFAGGTQETLPFTGAIPSFTVAGAPLLGIAAGPDRIVLGVTEAGNGARDLNTDGDTNDNLVAWIDTTAPANLRLMMLPFGLKAPVIDGVRGLVAIREGAIGFNGTDLNGDGDVNDDVVHVLDTSSPPGALTSLGFAVNTIAARGDDALLGVDEAADRGIDLNGDSAADDTVLRYVNLATGASRNLTVISGNFTFFRHPDGEVRIAALVAEGQSPTRDDLNADGDSDDVVLELISVDPAGTPAIVAPTPFVAGTAAAATANTAPLRAGTEVFVFATFEPMDGRDLSGDSDVTDTVLRFVTYAGAP